jgi:hypothetical protein
MADEKTTITVISSLALVCDVREEKDGQFIQHSFTLKPGANEVDADVLKLWAAQNRDFPAVSSGAIAWDQSAAPVGNDPDPVAEDLNAQKGADNLAELDKSPAQVVDEKKDAK